MKVYISNLGYQNVHWPLCLNEGVLTLQTSKELFEFWSNNEKAGWLEWARANETLSNGQPATASVASRWYNLINIFHETAEDIWIHREKNDLYWTTSHASLISQAEIPDPFGGKRKQILLKKPCDPWLNRNQKGRVLQWQTLHRKSHDFLATEATYQEIANDRGYRDYAIALIEGRALEQWEIRSEWKAKSASKNPLRSFSNLEITIIDALYTINNTVSQANGQLVERISKEKNLLVTNEELKIFLENLYRESEGLCALTGLQMLLKDDEGAGDFRLSVDRIDSQGHYEPTNLQLVCRFANFWKSARDDKRFKELMQIVRTGAY